MSPHPSAPPTTTATPAASTAADVEALLHLIGEAGEARSDVNRDGGVDGADAETFFNVWTACGC
jgi:hypothetical protein